uniref:RxLR effector protein n=1 Tax=Phytophthora sojae TaxID=67593 RepID=G1FSZ0_PHYSO|nr:Avh350a1 [Phytophthora sojae]
MRVCFVLLAAAATLLASNEVTAVSSHAGLSKMTAKEETQTIDAAAMAATGHRHLRSHEAAGEERASVPVNLISLKDLMKVDDLVDPKTLRAALEKSAKASKIRLAMFDEMFGNADIRREVLARLDKLDDFKPLKSAWTRYILRKGVEYERQQEKAVAAAAAARRGGN